MEFNKKQTALQLVIEQLHKHKRILKDHFEEGKWNDDRCSEIDNCILICESKLPMEREQIVNAWKEDRVMVFFDDKGDDLNEEDIHELAKKYYVETYGK